MELISMAVVGKVESSKSSKTSWIGMAVLFFGLLIINQFIFSQRVQLGLQKSEFYDAPKKILGGAFREVRVTIADILWVKVDTYFHAALTPEEHEQIHPGHPEHMLGISHSDTARAVAETQFLPLIKIITELDPNFITAYSIGGWWLWQKLNQVPQAIAFFKEGIQNNPTSFQLHYDLATLYFWKLNDYEKAKGELLAALNLEMDNRTRVEIMNLLGYTYERLNDNANAIQIWEQIEKTNVPPYSNSAKRRLVELRSVPKKPLGK
jgi:tetratricopeptide (TPR) repeat protein